MPSDGLQPNLPVNYGDDNRSVYGDTRSIDMPTDDGNVPVSGALGLRRLAH